MIKCDTCGNTLSSEEKESPRKNYLDLPICDQCYEEAYQQPCALCKELFDEPESPEETFFVLSEEFTYTDEESIESGVYKVTVWPYREIGFADGFSIHKNTVEKVAEHNSEESGEICLYCYNKAIKKNVL
jgi:hypothetical protein